MELACEDINVSHDFYMMWDSNTHSKETLLKSLIDVCSEAKDAESTASALARHIRGLHKKLLAVKLLLSGSSARQCPEMKRLLFQLEALQLHITEIQSDVTGITEDIKTVLNGKDAPTGPALPAFTETPGILDNTDDNDDRSKNSSASSGVGEKCNSSSQNAGGAGVDVKGSDSEPCDCSACQQKQWYETHVVPTLLKPPQDTKQKKCYICHQRIANRDSHMEKYHPGQKAFPCRQCPMEYNNFKDFQNHQSIHKVALIKQRKRTISQAFPNILQEARQNKSIHQGVNIQGHGSSVVLLPIPTTSNHKTLSKCYICHETVSHRDRHMKIFHPGQKNYCCSHCSMTFDNYKDFRKHKAIHKVTAFKCDLCNRVYKSKSLLFEHIEAHLKEKPAYMCHVCGEIFKNRKSLSTCKHRQPRIRKVPKDSLSGKLAELKKLLVSSPVLCQICGKSFSNMESLKAHLNIHSEYVNPEKPYKCGTCGKRFAFDYHLKKHLQFHKEKSHTCETCNQSFPTKRQKKIHRSIHHKGETFNCFFCLKTFTEQKSLDHHLNVHTGEKPFACEVCGKRFPSLSGKENHQYRIHRRGWLHFKCVLCDKKFPSNFVRETHYLRAHSQQELDSHNILIQRVQCHCGKLVRKEYLKRHMATHSARESFTCEVCGKKLPDLTSLKRHSLCHLEKAEGSVALEAAGPHLCDICGKGYSYASYLKQHKLLHSQGLEGTLDSLECDVCGKKFATKSAILQHKVLHTPNQGKTHICDICGRGFRLKCLLKTHYTTHTGEQPFRCAVCGKGFLTNQGLVNHNRVHTKEKPFVCEVCGWSFASYSNRQRHMIVHTGERPYQCDCCGKRFRQKGVMLVHRRVHTGEKPYQCDICEKRFADPSTLKKHKAIHLKNAQICQPASICVL